MVKLRLLNENDAPNLAIIANNKKIWDNLRNRMPFPYSIKDAENFINLTKEEIINFTFGIEFNSKLCGVIGLIPQEDIYSHSAEVGYWIGEEFWGNGIATHALSLIIDYAFDILKIKRLFANVFFSNFASQKVLEKCGFEKEGHFKSSVLKNEKYLDELRFGLINKKALI